MATTKGWWPGYGELPLGKAPVAAWLIPIEYDRLPMRNRACERRPVRKALIVATRLRWAWRNGSIEIMTDKQAVMDALQRLPEDASLEEISEELRIMASIRRGRADIAAGRTKTHEEAERFFESWATAWTSR
jgi:predicted transcriptional regulator